MVNASDRELRCLHIERAVVIANVHDDQLGLCLIGGVPFPLPFATVCRGDIQRNDPPIDPTAASALAITPASTCTPSTVSSVGNPTNTATNAATAQTIMATALRESFGMA
jgi:hypothetical protein